MPFRRNSVPAIAMLAGATFSVLVSGVGPASASCAPRVSASASATTNAHAFALAVAAWEGKVANTINDLYSDWAYARRKQSTARVIARKHLVSVSAIPCNS